MKSYGGKIKGGCRCEYCYNSKSKGKTPKSRERQKARIIIKKEIKEPKD